MLGASAVVVQMLIQRGKDKCRLIEVPDGQARFVLVWFAAPNDVRYPLRFAVLGPPNRPDTGSTSMYQVEERRPVRPIRPHGDKQWLLVKSWQNGLSPDV
jgi:hypothetical protein